MSIAVMYGLLKQAAGLGSRSTVLRPLGWLITICAFTVLGAVGVKAPAWIIWLFGVGAGLGILLYLGAYIYCLLTKREDLLRSETFSLQKLAIEKGFVGDALAGVLAPEAGERLSGLSKEAASGGK